MERVEISREQLERAVALLAKHPDLDKLEADLERVQLLEGSPAALPFKSAAEVLQAVRLKVLDPDESRRWFGLPPRRRWWRLWAPPSAQAGDHR